MKKIILAACGLMALATAHAQNTIDGNVGVYGIMKTGGASTGKTYITANGNMLVGAGGSIIGGDAFVISSRTNVTNTITFENGGVMSATFPPGIDGTVIQKPAATSKIFLQDGASTPRQVNLISTGNVEMRIDAGAYGTNPPTMTSGGYDYTYTSFAASYPIKTYVPNASITLYSINTVTDIFSYNGSTWTNLKNNVTGATTTFTVPTTGATTIVLAKVTQTLPLTLTTFNVARNGNAAQLSWSATNQVNFSHFEVEVLGAGNVYTKIATVNGNTTGSYTLTDATSFSKAISGKTNYRLKMVDKDGKYSYSAVRFVTFDGKGGITIYPNPATNYVSVSGLSGKTQLMLVNGAGQQVSSMVTANTTETLDVRTLAKGVYYLRVIKDGEIMSTEKVVKQ